MSRYPADYQLCLRVRDGDDWAFEELLHRHRDILHFRTAGIGVPGEDREDVHQAARVALHAAAMDYRPDCHSTFRSFAALVVGRRVDTFIKTALRGYNAPLNEAARFESHTTLDPENEQTVGDLITAPDTDLCDVIEARDRFRRQVAVLVDASIIERAAVVHRLDGKPYPKGSPGYKQIDNALQRVRRKLAAVA